MFIVLAIGFLISSILTWAFDVSPWVWGMSWLLTGLSLSLILFSAETALAGGLLGFTILAIIITTLGDNNEGGRSEHGFTRKESDCLQYQAMGHREAFRTNDCAEVLRNAR